MPYSRKQLVDLRNNSQQQSSSSSSSSFVKQIPKELRRESAQKPVISYSRQQLLTIRENSQQQQQQQDDGFAQATATCLPNLPDDLRRPSRFRCDSNCTNEQQHEQKKILKYTRNELLRYKNETPTLSCAAQMRALDAQMTAPEIFLRSLGR